MDLYIQLVIAQHNVVGYQSGDTVLYAAGDICRALRVYPPAQVILPHVTISYYLYNILPRCQWDENSDHTVVDYLTRSTFVETRPEPLRRAQPLNPQPAAKDVYKVGQGVDKLKATLIAKGVEMRVAVINGVQQEVVHLKALAALPEMKAFMTHLRDAVRLRDVNNEIFIELNVVIQTIAGMLKTHVLSFILDASHVYHTEDAHRSTVRAHSFR